MQKIRIHLDAKVRAAQTVVLIFVEWLKKSEESNDGGF